MEMKDHKNQHTAKEHNKHYKHLLIMAILSFIAMYILMYAMVDTFSNVFMNINQFYMAGLMASPMVIIELIIMRAMYMNKKLNMLLIAVSTILLIGFYVLIRQQTAVGDKQFLKSMIPHHAGAILMCEEASITDPEIKKLCEQINSSQKAEIAQMKAKLSELKK
jgi:cation transport ATPase